ncbi:hypothetical protein FRC04_002881 [Tulasnella sp. 424]|nr:hypothetical protein FRC04_002881 [Tulasnella sp. 424]
MIRQTARQDLLLTSRGRREIGRFESLTRTTLLYKAPAAEPELADLDFGAVSGPGTQKARSDVAFRMGSPKGQQPASKAYPLLVEVKCPWTLPYSDMHEISRLRDGLPLTTDSNRKKYNKAQSVLGQVYDYCTEQEHCFWIISTYEYWIFGVFSENYETAMVTEPIRYDSHSPTTLQCILYWIQSATFRPGAFEIPKCAASLDGRNRSVDPGSTWLEPDLRGACGEILNWKVLGTLNSHVKWTIALTWLALLVDPISVTPELPCLESAFAAASSKVAGQPGRLHFGVQEQSSPKIERAQGRVDPTAPTIWSAGTALEPEESLKAFFLSHASREVAFILDRYLPQHTRNVLERRLVTLQVLSRAPRGTQSKGSGVDIACDTEGTPSKCKGIKERTHSSPSVSERSAKCSPSGTPSNSNILREAIALWKNNTCSGNTNGPSSTPRRQGVGARPSAGFAYRTNSDAWTASPATPVTPAASTPNPSSPLSSPEWTRRGSATPDPRAGGEDDDKVGSLMVRLGGLSVKSPASGGTNTRPLRRSPRNFGKSRPSAKNDDGNPFIL